eukprot:6184514-Pleurochrysis_carterae.AAC.2
MHERTRRALEGAGKQQHVAVQELSCLFSVLLRFKQPSHCRPQRQVLLPLSLDADALCCALLTSRLRLADVLHRRCRARARGA